MFQGLDPATSKATAVPVNIPKEIELWAKELNNTYVVQHSDILSNLKKSGSERIATLTKQIDTFSKKVGVVPSTNKFEDKVNALHKWFLKQGYYFNAAIINANFNTGTHALFSANLIKIDQLKTIQFNQLNLFGFDSGKIPDVKVYNGRFLVKPFNLDYAQRADLSIKFEGTNVQSPINPKTTYAIVSNSSNGQAKNTQAYDYKFDKTASNEAGHALFYLSDYFQNRSDNVKLNEAYGDYVTLTTQALN